MHKTINIIYYQDKQTVDDMSGLVVALLIPLSYSDNSALSKVDTSALLITCITHHMHYIVNFTYRIVGNFRGVQIFVHFVHSACPRKITYITT